MCVLSVDVDVYLVRPLTSLYKETHNTRANDTTSLVRTTIVLSSGRLSFPRPRILLQTTQLVAGIEPLWESIGAVIRCLPAYRFNVVRLVCPARRSRSTETRWLSRYTAVQHASGRLPLCLHTLVAQICDMDTKARKKTTSTGVRSSPCKPPFLRMGWGQSTLDTDRHATRSAFAPTPVSGDLYAYIYLNLVRHECTI